MSAFPPPPLLQGLELYNAVCLGEAEPSQSTLPMTCPGPEDKTVGATPDLVSASMEPAGNRPQLGYSYGGPGWLDGVVPIEGEMLADNISNYVDYLCDGVSDKLGSFQWTDSGAVTQEALGATLGSDVINVSNASVLPASGGYVRIESAIAPGRTKIEVMILTAKSGDGPGGVQDTMTVTRIDPSSHSTNARVDVATNTTTPGPYDFVLRSTARGPGTGYTARTSPTLTRSSPFPWAPWFPGPGRPTHTSGSWAPFLQRCRGSHPRQLDRIGAVVEAGDGVQRGHFRGVTVVPHRPRELR